jgi:hypothetical protein
LITCASTLTSLLVLWILWKTFRAIWLSVRAPRGGWRIDIIEEADGDHWKQGVWVRKRPGFIRTIKNGWRKLSRVTTKNQDEDGVDPDVLVVEERRPLLG